eukprot:TRINITY_DN16504_c0_g1_i1.p1 TRINITY_DN16504_c0_g1~~TRINITY_DN16504_c0_g1_i1.p1  ORF type:complete len:109 (+),score=29.70 TRINITY_DN16504_c0_g1_i1:159-485(+)
MVEQKRGELALFYGLDCSIQWQIDHLWDHQPVRGVIRLYNIGQDTQFSLGGDTDTSFMYQMGHPQLDERVLERVLAAGSEAFELLCTCLLYTSPSPRDRTRSRMPSSA